MQLTLIVTIDPVKSISHLDVLVHALNLQTCRDFDVVFFNQTLRTPSEIEAGLRVKPNFPTRAFDVPREDFLGSYPIWDLYALHCRLLEEGPVGDYVMALHMEEFPDVDYVEHLLDVLKRERFDILFGNLTRTRSKREDVAPLLETVTADAFDRGVEALGLKACPHWSFDHLPVLRYERPRWLLPRLLRWASFGFRKALPPTSAGFTRLRRDLAEDVFAMSVSFAKRYNWFLSGHRLYFEDVHIVGNSAVGYLTRTLRKKTTYPVYFNRRKMYHLEHGRFYYQLEDETFTSMMLERSVQDPVLRALQHGIRAYRAGEMTMGEALTYTRRNPEGTGTQDLNFELHMRYLTDRGRSVDQA